MKITQLFIALLLLCPILLQSQSTDKLFAKYSFNNGTAQDEVGDVDGDMNNIILAPDRFGNPDYAIEFQDNSHIDFGDNFDLFSTPDTSFSFSFWIKSLIPANATQGRTMISKNANSACSPSENQREFSISILDNKRLAFVFYSNLLTSTQKTIQTNTQITDSNWHHIVVNYDGSIDTNNGLDRLEIYLDNVQQTLSFSVNLGNTENIQNGTAHLGMGRTLDSNGDPCANQFLGYLDDVRFYAKKLSALEIQELYNESNPTGGVRIGVQAFFDENENGIQDNNEQNLNLGFTLDPSSIFHTGNQSETFFYLNDFGTYYLDYSNNLWSVLGDATPTISYLDETLNDTIYYIPMIPVADFAIQNIDLSSSITRCNQDVNYWISYANLGTSITDGYVQLIQDQDVNLVSSNPPADSTAGNSLFWFYEDLYPTYSNQIHLVYQMPNVDFIGSDIAFEAEIQTWEGFADDKSILSSELVCAYDPNDKLVTPMGIGQEQFTLFGDTLEYTIRFQNTGNDTAFTIVVRDTLDEHLDLASFRPISNSHDMQTMVDGNSRIATFTFEDIYLPDSFVNEIGSHGFVKFQIQTNNNLANFTTIENTAGIYFDVNPPIVTNTVSNTFAESIPSVFYGKILLEGNYEATIDKMTIADNYMLPLTQPYNNAPWNYEGTEALIGLPENMIDWVLVEARSGTASLINPATEVVERHVGILLDNGEIVNTTGSNGIRFLNLMEGESYHYVIRHRNHLDVMTAPPLMATTDVFYDFTENTASAFGSAQQKLASNGKAMLYAGDANGDGIIQTTDYDMWFSNNAVINIYSPIDFNLDGIIQVTDYDLWFLNKAKIGSGEIQY